MEEVKIEMEAEEVAEAKMENLTPEEKINS